MHPALIEHSIPLLPGLPEYLAGRPVAFDLPKQLRLRMRHPEKIKVSEWAAQYRVVSDGAHEGPWRHEYAPHTVKVMDTFGLPWVREVWFCGVEQSGKTNTMINCIGWAIDCDPGGIFYLMPTEDTAAKVTSGKLRPTIEKSPRLARYLSPREADTTLARIRLQHGVTIWPAHANSASSMATWTAKHCFGDEVDKYPATTGKESDPITLIKKRNRNYKGRYKRFFSSTPAGLFIYKGVQNCHQVWEYRLKCPHCEEYIKLDADHLVIPEQATPEQIERESCGYACNECGTVWDDQTREHAIRLGHWYCVQGSDNPRPHKVGFHHRAWECLDITLAEIGAAWLRASQGDHSAKVAWANGYEAIDFVEEQKSVVTEAELMRYKSDLPRNLIPPDTAALWLLADTQQDSFYYELWSCSYAPDLHLHMVNHGIVQQFNDLEGILTRAYEDHEKRQFRTSNGLIDSGGTRKGWQKHSRTMEVYEWCSRHRVMLPHKGMHGRTGDLVSFKSVATFPGTNKAIPGGLTRANLRVDLFKDELERLLTLDPESPSALSFHCEIDEAFVKHFMAERKDENGEWTHNKKWRNDYFDCAVYALALREILKLRIGRKPPPEEPSKTTKPAPRKQGFVKGWKP